MIIELLSLLFMTIVPGVMLVYLFFEEEDILEKVLLTILLSIAFYVILATFLGFSDTLAKITGGLKYIWLYSVILDLIIAGALVYKLSKKSKHKPAKSAKKEHVK